MRFVLQRVNSASVIIRDLEYSSISKGLLCLVAFCETDTEDDYNWAIKKIIHLKLFDKKKSLNDINGELLIVSQFTLFASIKKGAIPSWSRAASPNIAKQMYNDFIITCHKVGFSKIKTGVFGADMQIKSINNGPITIIIDTKNKE